jgi:hypothetical protein
MHIRDVNYTIAALVPCLSLKIIRRIGKSLTDGQTASATALLS